MSAEEEGDIVYGRIQSLGPGEDLLWMQFGLIKEIQKGMCKECMIRIVVIPEAACTALFYFTHKRCERIGIPFITRENFGDEDWCPPVDAFDIWNT